MAPMRDAGNRALTRPQPRGAAAPVALLVLVLAGFAALSAIRPHAARTGDVPPTEFSAGRAFEQVRTVAARPHPAGSAANSDVRAHLLTTLRGYGLNPQVQEADSIQGGELSASAGGVGLAHVQNVVTTIRG